MIDKILLALFKEERMWYQQIVDLGIRRKDARIKLDELKRRRLVLEEGRERKDQRGRKLYYSLTKKGRAECLLQSVNDLNASLKVLGDMSSAIISNPSRIDELREKDKQLLLDAKITESMPPEERLRIVRTDMKRVYGPLMEAYKAMHKLMVQLEAPRIMRDYEFFIGLTKEGAIRMIPKVTLENLRKGEIKFYEGILRMLQDLITEGERGKMLSGIRLISSKISERKNQLSPQND